MWQFTLVHGLLIGGGTSAGTVNLVERAGLAPTHRGE
jgi:hypothetical protein